MFKAQTLDGVGEFDVHAEIVRIKFQLVTIRERLVFLDIHRKRRDGTVNGQFPVFVLFG